MKSPCRGCENEFEDKNARMCVVCKDRMEYVMAIGKCPGSAVSANVHLNGEHEQGEKIVQKYRDRGPGIGDQGPASGPEGDQWVKMENIQNMKICTRKDCPHEGKPQPLNEFDNNNASKDGKSSNCKECRRRMQTKIRNRKKAEKTMTKSTQVKSAAGSPLENLTRQAEKTKSSRNEHTLIIDFTNHPKILERLKEIAALEIRGPENMILYWVKLKTSFYKLGD